MPPTLNIAPALLAWYHKHRRILPFREDPTPYHVWVSEIMLQQTRVSAALPYYERFMAELPDVPALAAASEEKLHKLWEGLGYYSRVRNLQKAAQQVVEQYGGQLPKSYDALLALPGIGPYTAGAIASIAFGLPAVAVDGNVLRVFSRLCDDDGDIALPAVKTRLAKEVAAQQPKDAPGDYNQALMELGALVCLPGAPACLACPLHEQCRGYAAGTAPHLPHKAAKKPKQEIPVLVLIVKTPGGVLLHKREDGGLLAGLWQPFVQEGTAPLPKEEVAALARGVLPGAELQCPLPAARHIFTHKIWHLWGWVCTAPAPQTLPEGFVLASAETLQTQYALPGAFKAYRPFLLEP